MNAVKSKSNITPLVPRPLKDLTLLDRFLFNTAVSDREIFQAMLGIIFDQKDFAGIRYGVTEKELKPYYDSRAVRLDLLAFDEADTVYNTEAQKQNTGFENLCRRSRFYQAHIDVNLMKPGDINFSELNDVFIIFISPFDLFGQDRYMYTFRMRSDEDTTLTLPDGAVHIYLNTRGTNSDEVSPELVQFLHYMEDTNNPDLPIHTERLENLASQIRALKENQEVGVKYMQLWEERIYEQQEARKEGRAEGMAQGMAKGRAIGMTEGELLKTIRQTLKLLGRYPLSEIADLLDTDMAVLQSITDIHAGNPDADAADILSLMTQREDDSI